MPAMENRRGIGHTDDPKANIFAETLENKLTINKHILKTLSTGNISKTFTKI